MARREMHAEPLQREPETETHPFQHGLFGNPVAKERGARSRVARGLHGRELRAEEVRAGDAERIDVVALAFHIGTERVASADRQQDPTMRVTQIE